MLLSLRGSRPTLLERAGGTVGVARAAARADKGRGRADEVEDRLGVQDLVASPLLSGSRSAGTLSGFGATDDATAHRSSAASLGPVVVAEGPFSSWSGALTLNSICLGDGEAKSFCEWLRACTKDVCEARKEVA